MINATESVSLHVRRGDYVSDLATNLRHGTCSVDYYRQAAGVIACRINRPHFFVFSDDLPWARAHLRLDYPMTLVGESERLPEYDDLRLMMQCRHHIIANSTFSWWGAWLGTHPGKIVIAPQRWFADSDKLTADLLPREWLKL